MIEMMDIVQSSDGRLIDRLVTEQDFSPKRRKMMKTSKLEILGGRASDYEMESEQEHGLETEDIFRGMTLCIQSC